jgi:cytochrome c-type biogenesis protein CcsB
MLALYSAMLVYAIAFIFYAIDLANRAGAEPVAAPIDGAASASATATKQRASRSLKIGFSLTILAFVFHLIATVFRGIEAERVPWANMYEFSLSATLAIVFIFLIVNIWTDIRFLGVLVVGLVLLFLGVTRVNYYVAVVPLPPALDSYWLVIHILVAVLAVGFFTLAFGLSVVQLVQSRRERRIAAAANVSGVENAPAVENAAKKSRFLASFPSSDALENLAYRVAIIGFVFWTFTLIAGSIWAEHAWGRYWGWDTKEVWTFVIWVLYAGYIHARATRGWRGDRSAWLSIVAYAAVIFNFAIVNVFFKGLHAYSGL